MRLASANVYASTSKIYNSILWSPGKFPAPSTGELEGNVFWGADASQVKAESGFVRAPPRLADAATGDFRINGNSPAWRGGTAFSNNIATYVVGDYSGNPIKFTRAGEVVIGAVHVRGNESVGMAIYCQ